MQKLHKWNNCSTKFQLHFPLIFMHFALSKVLISPVKIAVYDQFRWQTEGTACGWYEETPNLHSWTTDEVRCRTSDLRRTSEPMTEAEKKIVTEAAERWKARPWMSSRYYHIFSFIILGKGPRYLFINNVLDITRIQAFWYDFGEKMHFEHGQKITWHCRPWFHTEREVHCILSQNIRFTYYATLCQDILTLQRSSSICSTKICVYKIYESTWRHSIWFMINHYIIPKITPWETNCIQITFLCLACVRAPSSCFSRLCSSLTLRGPRSSAGKCLQNFLTAINTKNTSNN